MMQCSFKYIQKIIHDYYSAEADHAARAQITDLLVAAERRSLSAPSIHVEITWRSIGFSSDALVGVTENRKQSS